MVNFANSPKHSAIQSPGAARVKLRRLAQLMRVLSAAYAAWVLWRIVSWWTDADLVKQGMGHYLKLDLSGLAASQRMTAMGLDLLVWLLLLVAVVYCWKLLACLLKDKGFTETAAHNLMQCAWWALACQTFSVLSRPLHTWFLTWHLPAAEQVFRWRFAASDLQGVLLCLALLMFAYLFSWVLEVAEENRGFV